MHSGTITSGLSIDADDVSVLTATVPVVWPFCVIAAFGAKVLPIQALPLLLLNVVAS